MKKLVVIYVFFIFSLSLLGIDINSVRYVINLKSNGNIVQSQLLLDNILFSKAEAVILENKFIENNFHILQELKKNKIYVGIEVKIKNYSNKDIREIVFSFDKKYKPDFFVLKADNLLQSEKQKILDMLKIKASVTFSDFFDFPKEIILEKDMSSVRKLVLAVSKGGVYQTCISLDNRGRINVEDEENLKKIGIFLSYAKESVFFTYSSIFEKLQFYGCSTTNNNAVYLHIFKNPKDNLLLIPEINNRIKKISFLKNGQRVNFRYIYNQIQMRIPKDEVVEEDLIIKIETEEVPQSNLENYCFDGREDLFLFPFMAYIYSENSSPIYQIINNEIILNNINKNNKIKMSWNFEVKNKEWYKIKVKMANISDDVLNFKVLVNNMEYSAFIPKDEGELKFYTVQFIDIKKGDNRISIDLSDNKNSFKFESIVLEHVN